MEIIPPWLVPLGSASAAALSIWNLFQLFSRRNDGAINKLEQVLKETQEDLKAVDDKVDDVEGRVSTLETIMQSLPDKDSLHRLEITLTTLSGQIENLNTRIGPIDNLSRRLQEVLLDRANDR